jgi:predicted ATP-dependent protease
MLGKAETCTEVRTTQTFFTWTYATLTGSISIEPAAIPLEIKVVLLAEPEIYYEILEVEPELGSVFKIRADFTDTLQRNDSNDNDIIYNLLPTMYRPTNYYLLIVLHCLHS